MPRAAKLDRKAHFSPLTNVYDYFSRKKVSNRALRDASRTRGGSAPQRRIRDRACEPTAPAGDQADSNADVTGNATGASVSHDVGFSLAIRDGLSYLSCAGALVDLFDESLFGEIVRAALGAPHRAGWPVAFPCPP